MTDPELSDGARNLFTLLLDYSLNPGRWFKRKGQVAISNTQLRERLSRSARAIYGWTRELIQQRHIWVTKWGRPNMQPMNVFHIAALQPDRQVGPEIQNEGMWGDGYRRPEMVMPLGARGGGPARNDTTSLTSMGSLSLRKCLYFHVLSTKTVANILKGCRRFKPTPGTVRFRESDVANFIEGKLDAQPDAKADAKPDRVTRTKRPVSASK